MTPEDPIPLNRLERGRDLTDHECATFLADRQTALRHGTAQIAVEVADTYRERALAAESRVAELEAAKARMAVARAEHHNAGVVHEHCGPAEVAYHWGRACPVCLIHDEALAEPRRNALEADL